MQNKISLFVLLLFCLPLATEAQARRSVCGVDLSRNRRCWKELRRLRSACQEGMTLLGRSYQSKTLPAWRQLHKRYTRLWRTNRRRWLTSLCGVPLYSAPKSYCGLKGVEVAVRCIRSVQREQKPPPATPAVGLTRRTPPPAAPATRTPQPRNPAAQPAPTDPTPPPATASTATTAPNTQNTGTSGWLGLLLLQLLTLAFVLWLAMRQRQGSAKQQPRWQSARWAKDNLEQSWEGLAVSDTEASLTEKKFDILLRENLQALEQAWTSKLQKLTSSPSDELQKSADSLFHYYCLLARQILGQQEHQDAAPVQERLLQAREKLNWIFRSHREPDHHSSFISDFQKKTLRQIDQMLDEFGYVDVEESIKRHMAQGRFDLSDFLKSKTEDQARHFQSGQPLQNYEEIHGEFLHYLEQLYRSNLTSIQDHLHTSTSTDETQQEELYFSQFIGWFLLEGLPQQLKHVANQSSLSRVGALLDQLIQFIETQIAQYGLEFFPAPDPSTFENPIARVTYLQKAGLRDRKDPSHILRQPDASFFDQSSSSDQNTLMESVETIHTVDIVNERGVSSSPSFDQAISLEATENKEHTLERKEHASSTRLFGSEEDLLSLNNSNADPLHDQELEAPDPGATSSFGIHAPQSPSPMRQNIQEPSQKTHGLIPAITEASTATTEPPPAHKATQAFSMAPPEELLAALEEGDALNPTSENSNKNEKRHTQTFTTPSPTIAHADSDAPENEAAQETQHPEASFFTSQAPLPTGDVPHRQTEQFEVPSSISQSPRMTSEFTPSNDDPNKP